MSALLLADIALKVRGRELRREQIRKLATLYDRERALRMLLPPLCDRPLDPMRALHPRWHRDEARITREIMALIVSAIRAALWDRQQMTAQYINTALVNIRIDALRTALAAESARYVEQKQRQRVTAAAE